jgi:hypothetical protein
LLQRRRQRHCAVIVLFCHFASVQKWQWTV